MTPNVDPERLAAFMDGRLSEIERAKVLAELDASPELLDVYADAIAASAETDQPRNVVAADPEVRPIRRFRLTTRSLTAIAAVVVIAVATSVMLQRGGDGLPSPQVIATGLQPVGVSFLRDWNATPWPSVRGADDAESQGFGVRTGARVMHYLTLLNARDTSAATVAVEIATSLDASRFGGAAAAEFRELAKASPENVRSARIGLAVDAAEAALGKEEVRSGAWLQAMRIAASHRDTAAIRRLSSAAALGRLRIVVSARPNARDRVAQLQSALTAPVSNLSTIEALATEVLRDLAR